MYKIETIGKDLPLKDLNSYYHPQKFLAMCGQCPNYGALWSCPSYAFSPQDLLAPYSHIHLFGTKLIFAQSNCTPDFAKSALAHEKLKADAYVLALENAQPNALALYGGGCRLCSACARPQNLPCRKPNEMRYSLESLGYDVEGIAKDLLGTPLLWYKDKLPPYLMLVTALLAK